MPKHHEQPIIAYLKSGKHQVEVEIDGVFIVYHEEDGVLRALITFDYRVRDGDPQRATDSIINLHEPWPGIPMEQP